MTFEMSKHVALSDIHLVVMTVCLHNNYRCWVCGCELNRSRCCEYYYVNEFPFRNFSAVSTMKPQFTAPLLFTVTAATCGERNRVFLLLNYKSTQGLCGEMFGWIPAMRVQWTPHCICNSFDTPVMLVAHIHSCVSGVRQLCEMLQASWYMFAEAERGDMLVGFKIRQTFVIWNSQEPTAHARLWAANPSCIIQLCECLYQGYRLDCELLVSLVVQKYLSDLIRFVTVDLFRVLEEYCSVCDAVYSARSSFETSVKVQQTSLRIIPEHINLHMKKTNEFVLISTICL